jgi:tRNA(Ile)-lysidine synthase
MDQRFPTLEALFDNPLVQGRLLLAISGGGDSMALSLGIRDIAAAKKRAFQAAIVDHGLRAGSSDEARLVAHRLDGLGIPAVILPWNGAKPRIGVQEAARMVRHELLAVEARRIGAQCIVLAHTVEDQAETVAFRMARGSGVLGLSALAVLAPSPARSAGVGILVARPLLAETREGLRTYLRNRAVPWIDDPSNANERFARVRIRKRLAALKDAGFDPTRLAKIAEYAATLRQTLNAQSIALANSALTWATSLDAQLDEKTLRDVAPCVSANVLRALAYAIGGAERIPSLAAGQRLFTTIRETKGATLGGAQFSKRGATIKVGIMRPRGNAPQPPKDDGARARFAAALDDLPEWLRHSPPRVLA